MLNCNNYGFKYDSYSDSKKKFKYLISWIGGKKNLRKRISKYVPEDIKKYIEPFGGGAWVLFERDQWANAEVYNDLDGRLVNLFRMVKFHPEELIKELRYIITSREMFIKYLSYPGETEIKRAASFLYLILHSFGSSCTSFAVGKKINHYNIIERINQIHKRLDKVSIENRSYEKIIELYDSDNSFFYCDPPYSKGKGYIISSCEGFDHEKLRDILSNIKGRFLLSYDDSDLIRKLYKNFKIVAFDRHKGINNRNPKGRRYKELLILNYEQ